MANENKVQFNLRNCHYAKMLTSTPSETTYDTPVAVPGAVSLALAQVGEIKKFYADGIVYWQGSSNGGYDGDLEMARIPNQMMVDIWGMTMVETANVLLENANDKASSFAWLFEIDGDEDEQLYVLYNCTASRPSIDAKTNEETKEPQTQKLKFSAAALPNGDIKASTTPTTSSPVRTGWFKSVWQKSQAA